MSLFAAYGSHSDTNVESNEKNTEDLSWLGNSSFPDDLPKCGIFEVQTLGQKGINSPVEGKNDNQPSTPKKRKKKHKNESRKKSVEYENFEIDQSGARELLSVKTISRPSAPIYKIKYWIQNPKFTSLKVVKNKFKRYHKYMDIGHKVEDIILTTKNIKEVGFAPRDENFTVFAEEQKLSEKTGFYNGHLADNPSDIKIWLEYVNYQDTIHQFEKSHRKGSIAKAQRILGERKLSILNKALLSNPDSEILQRERLNIAVLTFPSDELQAYLKDLVEKDKSNIILWQGYIEATQCSMSHCNALDVLNLYIRCLSTLHQLRRTTSVERHTLEECILKMLYQCGLFLKQAGLFEQLWTLLRMYLELNLSPNDGNTFNILSEFNENDLTELEDVILTSNLPLHELWLRIEKLREACHWVPSSSEEACEDPQRMVFPEDVAQLIHPITMPENIFKLIAIAFFLLKIPLLPCRHTTMGEFGLDYVPWSLDSIEPLLSTFFPLFPVETSKNLWDDTRLAVGPQYLKRIPGHEEYLNFLLKLMENVTKCLTGDDKLAAVVWFFRFQRTLIILDKRGSFVATDKLKKRIKKTFKDFLRLEDNRQNEIYYLEYALTEYESGNVTGCIKTINAALSSSSRQMESSTWTPPTNRCHLYRHLVQLRIGETNQNEAVRLLCEMSLQRADLRSTEEVLRDAETRFRTVSRRLIASERKELSCVAHFLPDLFTDWIVCHGWFLFLTKPSDECFAFLDDVLRRLEISWRQEVLYEFYVAVLFRYAEQGADDAERRLNAVLDVGIETYPNNIFLLTVLEKRQTLANALGLRWWKLKKLLLGSDRALPSLYGAIIIDRHVRQFQQIVCDTVTGIKYEVNSSLKNQMLSFFKKVTSSTNTRKCGLLWRLYLQFVYTYFSPETCRKVYYSAVEECPWLKALYMDAAIYIPAELTQIQDLIIEKQLRLHVTPEELDVLRS